MVNWSAGVPEGATMTAWPYYSVWFNCNMPWRVVFDICLFVLVQVIIKIELRANIQEFIYTGWYWLKIEIRGYRSCFMLIVKIPVWFRKSMKITKLQAEEMAFNGET